MSAQFWGRKHGLGKRGRRISAGGENVFITDGLPDSPAFSATYELRRAKYLAPEVSMVNLPPAILNYDPHISAPPWMWQVSGGGRVAIRPSPGISGSDRQSGSRETADVRPKNGSR